MKRPYLFLLAALFAVSCHSGNEGSTSLFPVKSGSAYGYISRHGNVKIPFRYVRAGCFSGGVAVVATGVPRRWGYIDEDGRYVIPPEHCYATSFNEGLAFVVPEGGVPAAIDKNGVQQFSLPDAQSVENFNEGMAAYSILGPSGEVWGFVDRSGRTSILPQFSAVSYFSDGLCGVMNSNGYWGFVNATGDLVIDHVYDNVYPFKDGKAKIMLRGKWGVIDKVGRSVLPPRYNDVDLDGDMFLVKKGSKWGWLDAEGNELIPIRFADAYPFHGNTLAAARLGEKWGYIDGYGKYEIPARYDFAFGFDGGHALVEVNGRYGLIGRNGEYVVKPAYEHVPSDYFIRYFANTTAYYGVKTDVQRPVNVAYKWLTGFYHLDYYEANRYATGDTRTLLQQFAHMRDMISDSSKQRMMGLMIGIKDCKENENKAIVTYTLSDDRSKEQMLFLVKKHNKWLVQFTRPELGDEEQ
ncbi:hypothetical protein GCM10023093_18170 [Nemorincola caseinilytica]|uniref:WG repeat-containing protein n=1 Tax=Nemorincola caseinilytica TaxID=2054315 RepID=A0ABP8NDQ1_9BACT